MAAISNLTGCGHGGSATSFGERRFFKLRSLPGLKSRISWPSKTQLAVGHLGKSDKKFGVRMALVDDRLARSGSLAKPSEILACELVQGALVKWSSVMDKSLPEPPTAVFLHGILGSRKNWEFLWRLEVCFLTATVGIPLGDGLRLPAAIMGGVFSGVA